MFAPLPPVLVSSHIPSLSCTLGMSVVMATSASINLRDLDSAQASNWLGFARAVDQMLQDPNLTSQKSRMEIIQEVAQHRGLSRYSVERPLRAFRFLNTHYPELIEGRSETQCGFVSVLEIERLWQLAPEEARRVAEDVVSGRMTFSDIQERRRVAEARLAETSPGKIGGRLGLRKVAEQERRLADVVTSNIDVFIDEPVDRIELNPRIEPVAPDLLALTRSGERIAFDFKSGATALANPNLPVLLGRLALYDRLGLRVWLVVPEKHRNALENLASLARKVNLRCGFATISDNGDVQVVEAIGTP
jgi:hypothetical protein